MRSKTANQVTRQRIRFSMPRGPSTMPSDVPKAKVPNIQEINAGVDVVMEFLLSSRKQKQEATNA